MEDADQLKQERDELSALVEIQAAVLRRIRERGLRWSQRIDRWYRQAEEEYTEKHVQKCRICGKRHSTYDV
jgi:hypothetical protein